MSLFKLGKEPIMDTEGDHIISDLGDLVRVEWNGTYQHGEIRVWAGDRMYLRKNMYKPQPPEEPRSERFYGKKISMIPEFRGFALFPNVFRGANLFINMAKFDNDEGKLWEQMEYDEQHGENHYPGGYYNTYIADKRLLAINIALAKEQVEFRKKTMHKYKREVFYKFYQHKLMDVPSREEAERIFEEYKLQEGPTEFENCARKTYALKRIGIKSLDGKLFEDPYDQFRLMDRTCKLRMDMRPDEIDFMTHVPYFRDGDAIGDVKYCKPFKVDPNKVVDEIVAAWILRRDSRYDNRSPQEVRDAYVDELKKDIWADFLSSGNENYNSYNYNHFKALGFYD